MHTQAAAAHETAENEAGPSTVAAWLKQLLSPGTILTICTVICTAAVQHGANQERMDTIDKRVSAIESSYVPRAEHATKDSWIEQELQDIHRQLNTIEAALLNRQ